MYAVHPSVAYWQSILQNLKTKTGRSLEEWIALLEREAPDGEKERSEWLKTQHGLGRTTAALIAGHASGKNTTETDGSAYLAAAPGYVEAMYRGKEALRPAYDQILTLARKHFPDLKVCPCATIVPLYRRHVFAQIKPATKTRLELGLCLKGYNGILSPRLIDTGGLQKGDRITHRFHLASGEMPDAEMLEWLRIAYELDREP